MRKLAMVVLWPSFVAAVLAEGLFFSLFDPGELPRVELFDTVAVYTIGFFSFWALGAFASLLTHYLAAVPDDHNPPF
ncbi:hypothetical protein [Massilia cavernae]|uniref:Transmembrane protein n=1 Tax=Massilia cavernae TaxID=2320864 RepID=A0A418XR11_9BURK|nr:hypothetical protein [Massilia cavernae]RJG14945.1 hypothetical protein D3872_15425 [Massilia cavernae]